MSIHQCHEYLNLYCFYQIYTYNILFFINLIIYDIVLYLVVEVGDRHGICIAAFSRRSWRPMPLMSTPSTTMLPSWNIARLFQRLFVFCFLVAYCCIMSANLVPAPDSPFNCLLRLCQVLARRLPRLRQSKKCFLQLRGHGPSQLMEKITNKMAPVVE